MAMILRKHEADEIDPADPFKGDKLKRSVYANNLTTLIESATQPFVLNVNGR